MAHISLLDSSAQTPDSLIWTEDAHCLYLGFLEEAFVNDLYQGRYCVDNICGVANLISPPVIVMACSPSWLEMPQGPSPPSASKPEDVKLLGINAMPVASAVNSCHQQPSRGILRSSSTRRNRESLSQGEGPISATNTCESSLGNGIDFLPLCGQAATTSQSFMQSEGLVPKKSQCGMKPSKDKFKLSELNGASRMGKYQVVPSVWA